MSGNDDGDFVTMAEFKSTTTTIHSNISDIKKSLHNLASKKDIKKINLAFWGEDGRSGMVSDVNTLINRKEISNKILVFVASIVGSIITALIMAQLL